MVKYVYDAWGNQLVQNADGTECESGIGVLNPFRYRGYYYDEESKLYYLQTRYYDPKVGRFLNIDSLDYADPETINGLNLFAYCGNNPVMNVDPEGTWSWKGFGMIMAAIAIVAVVAVATAVTAGAAAAAIAGAAGFTTLGVEAVGTVVGVTALVSSVVVGSNEVAKQVTEKGAENINLVSVGISTIGGGVDGAFAAGSIFTSPIATIPLYAGRIAVSGLKSYLYGVSEGYSDQDMRKDTFTNMGATALAGIPMFFSKPATLLSLVLKPVITGGIKTLAETGKNIWRYFISPLIDRI